VTLRLLAALPALLLSACILSLQPLYTDADVAFDAALLGTWKPADAATSWTCTKSERGAYRVVFVDERGRKGDFSMHLVAIGAERFLDLFPVEASGSRQNAFYGDHWIPAHTFVRLLAVGANLEMELLDEERLRKLLAERPRTIAHETVGGRIVITASTAELQRFLVEQAGTPGAFRPLSLHKAA
jgi:hypothetical protein